MERYVPMSENHEVTAPQYNFTTRIVGPSTISPSGKVVAFDPSIFA